MAALVGFVYGLACYAAFLGTFVYAVGFIAGVFVPKGIDSGPAGPLVPTLAVDLALLSLFAVQHSVMARPAFKSWWTRIVPPSAERSTYVLASSLALALLFWRWRPLPAPVWSVAPAVARAVLWGLYTLGWLIALLSTFMISHTQLFGVSQSWRRLRGEGPAETPFRTPGLYRYLRHPLMLGFLVAFWATPDMTAGHLVFALACTGYIVFATLAFEERDLQRSLGEAYRDYQRRVPAFFPRLS